MKKFTAQATTVEEAVDIALSDLKITREESNIVIEEEGRKGFLGIGQKDAVVTVSVKESNEVSPIEELNLLSKNDSVDGATLKEETTVLTEPLEDISSVASPQAVSREQKTEEITQLSEEDINNIVEDYIAATTTSSRHIIAPLHSKL